MFFLKCSESGPLCPSIVVLSLSVEEPIKPPALSALASQRSDRNTGSITRTTLGSRAGRVCGVAAASRVTVFDVLHALRLVWVGEPVLAHVEVVGESYCTPSHEYFRYREGRHDGARVGKFGSGGSGGMLWKLQLRNVVYGEQANE
jgi:hypothetical protein